VRHGLTCSIHPFIINNNNNNHFPSVPAMLNLPKPEGFCFDPPKKNTEQKCLSMFLNQQTFIFYPCMRIHSVYPMYLSIFLPDFRCLYLHLSSDLRALGHALVHESEEADGAGADAHAVDEAAGEEGAEDGAEVGVGDLC
jgi:hypothetical protein